MTFYEDTSVCVRMMLELIKRYLVLIEDEEEYIEYVLNEVEDNLYSMDLIPVLGPKAEGELGEAFEAEHRYSSDYYNTPYCDKHILNSDWLHLMDELADVLNCSVAKVIDNYCDV